MPRYPAANFTRFMNLARAADPNLDAALNRMRPRRSTLKPLVDLLNEDTCSRMKVRKALLGLADKSGGTYVTKANKYKEAIYYLERTYPGLEPGFRISVKPRQSEAARFVQTATQPQGQTEWKSWVNPDTMQAMWSPYCTNFTAPAPSNAERLGMTVEDYLMQNPQTAVILLIHMQNPQNDRTILWDGWSAEHHMGMVLDVAQKLLIPLCVLKFPGMIGDPDVYPALAGIVNQFPNVVRVSQRAHSCVLDQNFTNLLQGGRNTVVVMGFEADICVKANVFGSQQVSEVAVPQGGGPAPAPLPTLVPALVNEANVVTSRPMLLNGGGGPIGAGWWGPLSMVN